MDLQLGREPLQRTNLEEIKELLRAAKQEQVRREETAHSRRQSQSSPHKGPQRSEHSSGSLDFDFSLDDNVRVPLWHSLDTTQSQTLSGSNSSKLHVVHSVRNA